MQARTHRELHIEYAMYHMFCKMLERDIRRQHLIPLLLLHFSLERQTESPECEEKFMQSFRQVKTLKLREMAL